MVRGRDAARSNARTAMPEPENKTTLSGEKGGIESEAPRRDTSRSKWEGKLPEEQLASQPCGETHAWQRPGERYHLPSRRSRPNPRGKRKATGPEEEGPRPTPSLARGPHTESTPEARTVECGTHSATEQTGRPKDDTRSPRGKAGPLARAQL